MSEFVEFDPAIAAALAQRGLARFDDFMRVAGDGPAASVHVDRDCVPLSLPGDPAVRCYLKRAWRRKRPRPWTRLSPRRTTSAQLWDEWRTLATLRRAGVSAMRGLAAGARIEQGVVAAAFLLVEASPHVKTLAEWLARRAESFVPHRRKLLARLGLELARLHAAGFGWRDAGPRHVFAEPNGADWDLCLIDLERVEPLGDAARDMARMLRAALPFEPTRGEQAAFALGYRRGGRALPALPRGVPRPAGGNRTPLLRPPSAGLPEQGLERVAPGLWINPNDRAQLQRAGLDTLDGLCAEQRGAGLGKPGLAAHRRRARIELTDGAVYFLKQFAAPPPADQLRRAATGGWRDSSAWRESHFARRLTAIGVATMRCAAVAEEMRGPLERRSALLVATVPGESLERWLPRHWPALPRVARSALVGQVAALARVMHQAGMFHRDFYPAHLFVAWPTADRPEVHLIDLARMLERPLRRERWRVKDLAALVHGLPECVSRGDRLRFLRWYLAEYDAPPLRRERHARIRPLIRAIRARQERMARHDLRRGRA